MKFFVKILVIFLSILLGFVIAKFFQVPSLTLSTQIDGVAVASLLISIVIAAIFYLFLDKEKEDKLREKNLLLDQVKVLLDHFGSQNMNFQYSNFELSLITSGIKQSFIKIKYLKELIEYSGVSCNYTMLNNLKIKVKALKDLQTDSPRNYSNTTAVNIPIIITNSLVTYSSTRKIEIERSYEEIYQETLKFLFHLNKK